MLFTPQMSPADPKVECPRIPAGPFRPATTLSSIKFPGLLDFPAAQLIFY
jgi:hypothetical protein